MLLYKLRSFLLRLQRRIQDFPEDRIDMTIEHFCSPDDFLSREQILGHANLNVNSDSYYFDKIISIGNHKEHRETL